MPGKIPDQSRLNIKRVGKFFPCLWFFGGDYEWKIKMREIVGMFTYSASENQGGVS
jgi:hypothetical protein